MEKKLAVSDKMEVIKQGWAIQRLLNDFEALAKISFKLYRVLFRAIVAMLILINHVIHTTYYKYCFHLYVICVSVCSHFKVKYNNKLHLLLKVNQIHFLSD